MSEREECYSTDVEEFSESGGTDPSDSSRISSNDSDGNEELGVQPFFYEPETNTEGNANITVLFYEITERVESKFWSFKKKIKTSAGIIVMFVLPGYQIRHDVLLMWKITACFHAVNTETVSMVQTCRFARKWTGLCMGVLLNGHLLAGISLELHLVAAWPYKPNWLWRPRSRHAWVFHRSRPLRSGQLHC